MFLPPRDNRIKELEKPEEAIWPGPPFRQVNTETIRVVCLFLGIFYEMGTTHPLGSDRA